LDPIFHRPALAGELSSRIMSTALVAPARSGLFLAAPRRTGKSTFLREDLIPALAASGAVVLYADLWADRAVDPGDAIVSLVRAALGAEDGLILKMVRKAGLDRISLGGMAFDVAKVGLGTGVSMSAALAALSDAVKRPIALIIDEAQHAATTKAGNDALFALKAARDELNGSAHHGLRIVATGSSRAKLGVLRSSKDQAFFKASMQSFPPLDRDYVAWIVENSGLRVLPDVGLTFGQFQRTGHRPEVLIDALGKIEEAGHDVRPDNVDALLESAVDAELEGGESAVLRVIQSLTPLQGAVLHVMAMQGEHFTPYGARTLDAYRVEAGRLGNTSDVTVPNVQTALDALLDKSLIWRAARGEYALEEQELLVLMRKRGLVP
jgi:hypothetical protein